MEDERDLCMPHGWPGQSRDTTPQVWVLAVLFWALWENLLINMKGTSHVLGEWNKIPFLKWGSHFLRNPVSCVISFLCLLHSVPYISCFFPLPNLTSAFGRINWNICFSGMPFLTNQSGPNLKILWTTCEFVNSLLFLLSFCLSVITWHVGLCALTVSSLRARKGSYFSLSLCLSTVHSS